MMRGKILPGLFAIFLLLGAYYSGYYVGGNSAADSPPDDLYGTESGASTGLDFSPFWKAWNTIDERYVSSGKEVTSDEERLWGAIGGLAASLGDPYTVFLPPAEAEIFEDDISGNFSGVGMEIGVRGGVLVVISPLKGSPAERAGILAGDAILQIDGEPSGEMTIDEAVSRIRGEEGTSVALTLLREGADAPIEITVVRETIQIPTLETRKLENGIFVIELYNFSATSPGLFRLALREFILSGSNKLILDLRGNPGGFLDVAIDMASWFLPPGEVVVRENFGAGKEERVHRSKGYDVFGDTLTMVVLVNEGSASASEILAGALQEHGVATLVGAKTFGKGSVQELIPITSGTSLKLTIARWLTPNGVSISEAGLTPDTLVDVSAEDIEKGRDPQFEAAISFLLTS